MAANIDFGCIHGGLVYGCFYEGGTGRVTGSMRM